MNIYLLNKSSVLKDADVQKWVPGFNLYADHVSAWWHQPAKILWCPVSQEPTEAWKVIFADKSDQAGALGYHDFTPGGRPVSYVFAADDLENGYSVTVTATHEIAEMMADPWISQAFAVGDNYFFAQEICDPVEDDSLAYDIVVGDLPPVKCSDFVTRNWFIPGSTGVFDRNHKVAKPLQILPGGYMSVFVSGKGWTQITADQAGMSEATGKAAKRKGGFSRLERYGRKRDLDFTLPV